MNVTLKKGENILEVLVDEPRGGQMSLEVSHQADAEVAVYFDYSGGTLKVDDTLSKINGASIYIPPGALSENSLISIRSGGFSSHPTTGTVSAGPMINFGTDGIVFSSPVFLTLLYDDKDHDGIVDYSDTPEEEVSAITFNPNTGQWEEIEIVNRDTINNTVTVKVIHLSGYGTSIPTIYSEKKVTVFTIDGLKFEVLFRDIINAPYQYYRPSYLRDAILNKNIVDLGLKLGDVVSYGGLYSSSSEVSWDGNANNTPELMQNLINELRLEYLKAKSENKKFIVVTHSWGTVLGTLALAYNWDIVPDLYITLSSPLGTDNVEISGDPINEAISEIISIYTNTKIEETIEKNGPLGRTADTFDFPWINCWAMGDLISGPLNKDNVVDRQVNPPYDSWRSFLNTKKWHAITSLSIQYMSEDDYNTYGKYLIEYVKSELMQIIEKDSDSDTIPDYDDNCPFEENSLQEDLDEDDIGDKCDPDADGDGYYTNVLPGPNYDCDDLNSFINPGADESCSDNVDNNCDGQVNEGCHNDYFISTQLFYPNSIDLALGYDDSVDYITVTGPFNPSISDHGVSISVTLSGYTDINEVIGAKYEFTIHFKDGTSSVQSYTVESLNTNFVWMVSPADGEAVNTTTPTLVWDSVEGAANTHIVVSDSSGIIWWSPDFPFGTTSTVYNFNGNATALLEVGKEYGIQINSYDANWNQATTWSSFRVEEASPLMVNWEDYTFEYFDYSPATNGETYTPGISNNGIVCGFYKYVPYDKGFLYENGQLETIEYSPDEDIILYDVNNQKHVLGRVPSLGWFLYNNGSFLSLQDLPWDNARLSGYYDINDYDLIIGSFFPTYPNERNFFYYDGSNHVLIGTSIEGYRISSMYGVNNNGIVVGGCYIPGEGNKYTFTYNLYNKNFKIIDQLSVKNETYAEYHPLGINDYGHIAGQYRDNKGRIYGFIYKDSILQLDDYPYYIYDINNSGQVAGYCSSGTKTIGFVATPK